MTQSPAQMISERKGPCQKNILTQPLIGKDMEFKSVYF